jgi:hypothetical protein
MSLKLALTALPGMKRVVRWRSWWNRGGNFARRGGGPSNDKLFHDRERACLLPDQRGLRQFSQLRQAALLRDAAALVINRHHSSN